MVDLNVQRRLMEEASPKDRELIKLIQTDRNNIPSYLADIRFCKDCEEPFKVACRRKTLRHIVLHTCTVVMFLVIASISNYEYDYIGALREPTRDYTKSYSFNPDNWTYNSDYDNYCDVYADKNNISYKYLADQN